jgi:hypothetical protein
MHQIGNAKGNVKGKRRERKHNQSDEVVLCPFPIK